MLLLIILACRTTLVESEVACNGFEILCDRRLNQVTFAATHNSMSSAQEEWIPPNHLYAIPKQLQDGIRGLNLDTYLWLDEAYLCHGFCELGATPLRDTLEEIKFFLTATQMRF